MSGALGNSQVQGKNVAFSNGDKVRQTKLSFRRSQVLDKFIFAFPVLSTLWL
jgi:hypothetical protein